MMKKTIEELLESPYWVIDFLPEQVPENSPGQFFAVERWFLEKKRLAAVKKKHVRLILKLNCYRHISLEEEPDPTPEQLAKAVCKRYVHLLVDDSLILSEPDELHLTLFDPDEKLLALVRDLAASEGLFVWQP